MRHDTVPRLTKDQMPAPVPSPYALLEVGAAIGKLDQLSISNLLVPRQRSASQFMSNEELRAGSSLPLWELQTTQVALVPHLRMGKPE
jgi:hypothetical protein